MQRLFSMIFGITLIYASLLSAGEWQVDKEADNLVLFKSSTTLLDFDGTTENIDGYIYWEGDNFLPVGSEFYFEVQPATFETGIGKRDSDMRNDVLETDEYPISNFKGTLSKIEKSGDKYNVVAKGLFNLHGVEKELQIPATIVKNDDKIHVETEFGILLKDYNIEAPSLMAFVKVAQEIVLNIKFDLKEIKN